ncbi:MAG: AGE family epimerase/isomerase, partial [Candidatus Bipolaricaulota bacterium]|nr:AGE family epimerase/isomerase [Candidatus Bipolaricaulota bacterium]
PAYLATAKWAYDNLMRTFWDPEYGGVYWLVDSSGHPVSDRKLHYAQAFAIYGLSEYFRATDEGAALERAMELFRLLERHGADAARGGYIDGSGRDWGDLSDMRLSPDEPHSRKSMNSSLHLLEAFTNLLRVSSDPLLRMRHGDLVRVLVQQIVDPSTGHLRLFFDDAWRPLTAGVSFGHDIEASWLLTEAADAQGDADSRAAARTAALALAEAVLREGVDADGSLFGASGPRGIVSTHKDWWPQAEAVIGFENAFELSGDARSERAAYSSWDYIRARFVDATHGGWFKRLCPDGTPDPTSVKVGPWNCPYHHARMCLEMMARLEERADGNAEVGPRVERPSRSRARRS